MKYKVSFHQHEKWVRSKETKRFRREWHTPQPVEIEGTDLAGPCEESDSYIIYGSGHKAVAIFSGEDVASIVAMDAVVSNPQMAKISVLKNTDNKRRYQ